jgi:hypothetical protein
MDPIHFGPYDLRKLAIILATIMVFLCLAGLACRGDDVSAARERLKAIEAEKQEAAAVADAKAVEDLQRQAEEIALPAPVPDPISEHKQPTIKFESVTGAVPAARLPRAVLVVGQYCSPCQRMEKENPDLIGGADAPIQLVQNWLANDLEAWGINPGMQLGTPYLFILGKDGTVHHLDSGGLGCVLRGYQSRDAVLQYLALPEHGVSVEPAQSQPVVASVVGADSSPHAFAAVLSAHLLECSGAEQTSDEPFLFGGLFDFTIDAPESWKAIGAKIVTAQRIEFAAAGISVDWSGPSRSFALSKDKLKISPPVKVSLKKWSISYSAALDGLEFKPDLSSVTFLLTGAPDLTVRLK